MRRRGQGSASISAVVVFLSALLALGLMATILPPVADVLSGFREGLRERGERGSELIRIYIHTANETELEPPIITITNGYDRESILTDYVVVARDGRVLAAGKMGGSLDGIRIPAGARIDLTPADFGLSYGTFAAMADEVKAIYVRTAEGNSFGSSYGPPPKINPDYQLKISQSSQHIIVIGTTMTSYNFTILGNFTLPTTGDAMVVKNVILVDRNGYVRGGATAGNKWSDGSFSPNKIPDSLAAITRTTDVVPIGGYYVVPPFPTDFYCYYSQGVFSVYSGCDTNPRYIEMVEFYPVEYYTPGSPVTAAAYYARYGGETQTVYNPDLGRVVTITAQRPVTLQYHYGIPTTYIMTTTIGSTIVTSGVTTIGGAIRRYTTTQTIMVTTIVTPFQIQDVGSNIVMAPVIFNIISGSLGSCGLTHSHRDSRSCSGSINTPTKPNTYATRIGFNVDWSARYPRSNGYKYFDGVATITLSYGSLSKRYTYSGFTGSLSDTWILPTASPSGGTVDFSLATNGTCKWYWQDSNGNRREETKVCDFTITVWVEMVEVNFRTATATLAISGNFRDQIKSAIVNGTETLSGDAVAHLAGTVQGGQVIKVKAPIVLLNYIYGIAGSPPASPSGGGGGGGEIGAKLVCTLDQSAQSINPPPSGSGSSSSSSNQPLESISGGTVTNFSVQQNTVQVLRNVVCRPVTPSRSLPSPN
jgi:hypothetical protein